MVRNTSYLNLTGIWPSFFDTYPSKRSLGRTWIGGRVVGRLENEEKITELSGVNRSGVCSSRRRIYFDDDG